MLNLTTRAIRVSLVLLPLTAGVARAANSTADVCQRWVCDRADVSEGMSTGSVASCTQGDLLPPGRPNALKLVNLYRFLAGMPAVTEDPNFDMMAQACAIIQAANPITHTPTTASACYNAVGATASGRSSICGGQAVACIDLYMNDANGGGPGFGHRQWIFANSLGPVGFGSVGTGRGMTGSCFYQVGGTGKANIPYVAWPPGGPIPLAAITTTNVDKAGWSIQSDTINMGTSVTATVMDGATSMPVTVTGGLPSFGARFAMSIVPMGWTEQAGHSYAVTVSGTATPIAYTIQVVDCAGVTTAGCAAGGTGGAGGTTGTTGAGGATGSGGAGGAIGTGTGGVTGTTGAGGAATGAGGASTTGAGGGGPGAAGASGNTGSGSGASSGSGGGQSGRAAENPAQGGCSCTVPPGTLRGALAGLALALAAIVVPVIRRRRRRA